MAYSISLGPDGSSYIVRYLDDDQRSLIELMKYDSEGDLVWTKKFSVFAFSAPLAAHDGTIRFLTTDSSNRSMAILHSFDADGNILWECRIDGMENAAFFPSDRLILSADGTVFFSLNEFSLYDPLPSNYTICAVDGSGELKWRDRFNPTFGNFAAETDGDGKFYVLVDPDKLYCIGPEGDVLWNLTFEYVMDTNGRSIVIGSNGTVFVSYGRSVIDISDDGGVRWSRITPSRVISGIALGTCDTIYISIEDDPFEDVKGGICAFSPDGVMIWREDIGQGHVTPIVDDLGIVICCSQDHIYGIDLEGQVKWSYDAGGYVGAAKMTEEGILLFLVYDSSSTTVLIASDGVPVLTMTEWLSRNYAWIILLIVSSAFGAYIAWTLLNGRIKSGSDRYDPIKKWPKK